MVKDVSLKYAQPLISINDDSKVVYERKNEILKLKEVSGFLKKDSLLCDGAVYYRIPILLKKLTESHTMPAPHVDFHWITGFPYK